LSKESKFFSQSSQTGWGKEKEREKERERERKRERERDREREREAVSQSVPFFFSADHPQKAAREYGEPAGGGNQGYGVRASVKTR
jgi:hypothetical protein